MTNNKLNVLMPVCNYFNPDNRVLRAANTLQESGYNVIVLAYFKEGLSEEEYTGNGLIIKRIKIKIISIPIKQIRNLIMHLVWKRAARTFAESFKPEFIHCHVYNTLFLGKFCKKKFRSKVIYDNHEYFQDLKYLHRYPIIFRKWIARYEIRALQKFVDEMIVVSPGIAEAYAPVFNKSINIIRNIPDQTVLFGSNNTAPYYVTKFLTTQKLEGRKLLLYLGTNTQKGRGMDFIFKLVSALPEEYGLVIFGPRNEDELLYLRQKAIDEGINDRFGAFLSIPLPALYKISSFFYMGLSLIEPIYFSYLHSLPNKLFEYLSMGLPVISSEIPDQADLVGRNNVGLVIPFDILRAKGIILESETITFNPDMKSLFTWEAEKEQLLSLYESI